jgi:hypothetical protein
VEALNTPVVAPVMCLFGGRRDSLFLNPFKKVTKAPCKFQLLQGACSSPVVCSAPLFLPCSLQGFQGRDTSGITGSIPSKPMPRVRTMKNPARFSGRGFNPAPAWTFHRAVVVMAHRPQFVA